MGRGEQRGYETPEEAACEGFPERFITVVGVRIQGDTAYVWMLTNDQPPFEPYEEFCVREGGRWFADFGSGGFSTPSAAGGPGRGGSAGLGRAAPR